MISSSNLSWLDSSEQERRSVLELVSALNEPGTLDELGIGTIRDTIADTLFPGTSTIQTRARYFLFIPWILQMVEGGSPQRAEGRAQSLQLQLCHSLDEAHGPNQGVIGRESGAALQRWPLSIYWLGLERWGIRRYPGSIPSYFASLRRPSSWHGIGRALEEPVDSVRDEATAGVRDRWTSMPSPPEDFPEVASFLLTDEEGRFLRERVALSYPQSYLAHILQGSAADDADAGDYPWDHPVARTAPTSVQESLQDARLFSLVHWGAVLVYNLMLAKELKDKDGVGEFSTGLAKWSESMVETRPDLDRWDRISMWNRLLVANPRLRPQTRQFADRWYELAMTYPSSLIGETQETQRLIREREHTLKRGRARLTYAEARDRRRGYPMLGRLQFRWSQVKGISSDILTPLEQS